jgi:3-phytase
MKTSIPCLAWATALLSFVAAQDTNITLVPAATSFGGDNTVFVYGTTPFLIVNDGSAADGGFRTFAVSQSAPFEQKIHEKSGRSKISLAVHDVGGRNLIVNIPATDSLIRVFDAESGKKVKSNDKKQLGDWSTACVWRSQKSGDSYIFLFGKKKVIQYLIRGTKNLVEILEVGIEQGQ